MWPEPCLQRNIKWEGRRRPYGKASFSSVQSLSRVRLFATPWTTALYIRVITFLSVRWRNTLRLPGKLAKMSHLWFKEITWLDGKGGLKEAKRRKTNWEYSQLEEMITTLEGARIQEGCFVVKICRMQPLIGPGLRGFMSLSSVLQV